MIERDFCMILRKPYAFFIKIFKPLHLIMSLLACYLIFITNKILTFFNTYCIIIIGDSL